MFTFVSSARHAKTVALPNTVREVRGGKSSEEDDGEVLPWVLESVVLNEGLERLGGCMDEDNERHKGFFCGSRVRRVTLPSTLRVLGDNTFYDCYHLKMIISRQKTQTRAANGALREVRSGEAMLPEALETVGYSVLNGCPEIKQIWVGNDSKVLDFGRLCERVTMLPARSTMLGNKFLWDLRRQKDVVIPDGVQKIGKQWFKNTNIESVTIPKSVEEVGLYAFYGCEKFQKICVEDGCEASLFMTGVSKSVTVGPLPETMVGSAKVWDLRKQKNVVVPDGVERIGNQWFWGCEVESVTVPGSVREIGANAFSECKSLREVVFQGQSKLKIIGKGAFNGCKNLAKIDLPEELTSIEDKAFYGCESLEDIKLPDRLERVGEYCFFATSVRKIDFPASMKEIGEYAFRRCM